MEKTFEIDDTTNLLLNLSGGLLPSQLTLDEVRMLETRFGKKWFDELGYDLTYEKPNISEVSRNN